MFDDDELVTPVKGLNVTDAWVALQVLDKSAAAGVFQPNEFEILANFRRHLVSGIENAVGKNYDELLAEQRRALADKQRETQETQETQQPMQAIAE